MTTLKRNGTGTRNGGKGLFREKTKSRKALVSTFITTFGVANGVHKSIVDSEVTMDGLFGS